MAYEFSPSAVDARMQAFYGTGAWDEVVARDADRRLTHERMVVDQDLARVLGHGLLEYGKFDDLVGQAGNVVADDITDVVRSNTL